jgi:hypothetical protein
VVIGFSGSDYSLCLWDETLRPAIYQVITDERLGLAAWPQRENRMLMGIMRLIDDHLFA